MVREVDITAKEAWANSISSYPARYGAMCGLMESILWELSSRSLMSDIEITSYRDRMRVINSDTYIQNFYLGKYYGPPT